MAKTLLSQLSFLLLLSVAFQLREAAAYRLSPTESPSNPLIPSEKDLAGCWRSIGNSPGCIKEIFDSLVRFQFGIGPACCKAILDLNTNCWPSILPAIPLFRPFLEAQCSLTVGGEGGGDGGRHGGESAPVRIPAGAYGP